MFSLLLVCQFVCLSVTKKIVHRFSIRRWVRFGPETNLLDFVIDPDQLIAKLSGPFLIEKLT